MLYICWLCGTPGHQETHNRLLTTTQAVDSDPGTLYTTSKTDSILSRPQCWWLLGCWPASSSGATDYVVHTQPESTIVSCLIAKPPPPNTLKQHHA